MKIMSKACVQFLEGIAAILNQTLTALVFQELCQPASDLVCVAGIILNCFRNPEP